jgi:phage terminase large subunit-like protein
LLPIQTETPILIAHTTGATMSAEPLFATPARPGSSRVDAVAEVARLLGFELMDWQRLVVERATVADDPFREVIVSTPRQVGKSMLMALLIVERMLSARSELADRFEVARGAGFEALRCDNGSLLRLLSTEESSGHGESADLVVVDECWSLDSRVEQAVRPATVRRPGSQIWLCSTAGTSSSVWWRSKVDLGRQLVAEAPAGAATAFYEWAAPDGADVLDEAVWWACHPALAEGHVPLDVIRADAVALPVAEFGRAYCNVWSDALAGGWDVIDADLWNRSKA